MNKFLPEDIGLLRQELFKLQCPLVHSNEDCQSVAELLFQPSDHRSDLIKWFGEELLGDVCHGLNEVQVLGALGIPSLTDQNQNSLLLTWKLLIRLMHAKTSAENDGSTLQTERHYLNFMQQNVFSIQSDVTSTSQRVLTVPRDLKKDFQPRPGSIIPNLETLKKIKDGLDQEAASLAQLTESEKSTKTNITSSLKTLHDDCMARIHSFDQLYQNELKSMTEAVRSLSSASTSDSLGRSVHELHQTVVRINERNKNQAQVRQLYNKILTESKELDNLIARNDLVHN